MKLAKTINFVRMKGVDILRQLLVEEVLLRHTNQNWLLFSSEVPVKTIVVGFSGKIPELVHIDKAKSDNVPVIRRYTGGGTVIVDNSTAFVSFLMNSNDAETKPYPREIMAWTANIYDPVFNSSSSSSNGSHSNSSSSNSSSDSNCGINSSHNRINSNSGSDNNNSSNSNSRLFSLKENDYVFYDDKKIGGNAQTLTKDRWVHHTSFLWDFDPSNMRYLQMPAKRPEYRRNRPHTDFLATIKEHSKLTSLDHFSDSIKASLSKLYTIVEVPFEDVEAVVRNIEADTCKSAEELSRTKVEPI